MSVKISVIVPVYNAEQYLKISVNSILNQTLRDIEVILIDDCSTDNSGKICDEFAAIDDRVTVIHNENEGAAAARNAGLLMATGEYIGFVDADDWIEQNMYEVMLKNATEFCSDAVFCNYVAELPSTSQKVDVNSGKQNIYSSQDIKKKFLPYFFGYDYNELSNYKSYCSFADYNSYIWLCIYKRDVIEKAQITFPSERVYFNEDNLFNLSFIYNANTITHVDGYFYHYRFNQSSFTKTFNDKYLSNKINKYHYLSSFIKQNKLDANFQNRLKIKICIETINIINYYVNSNSQTFKNKYKNVKMIINSSLISEAFNDFEVKQLAFSQMKVYMYFAKKKAYLMLMMLSLVYGVLLNLRRKN
jgi:glycosyltransferase involved in cell wall biosynthesis